MKTLKEETKELIQKYGEDFNEVKRTFTITEAEDAVIQKWLCALLPRIRVIQESTYGTSEDGSIISDVPNYGTIGGGLKYSFTPTGIGTILTITEAITKEELNVTAELNFYGF